MRDDLAAPASHPLLNILPRWIRRGFAAINSSLRLKLVLLIVAGSYLIFSVAFTHNYLASRKMILKNVEQEASNLTDALANEIRMVLRGVEKVPDFLARRLEHRSYSVEQLIRLQSDFLEVIPDTSATTIA